MLKRITLYFVRLYLTSKRRGSVADDQEAIRHLIEAIKSNWIDKFYADQAHVADLDILTTVNGALKTDPIAGIRLATTKEADDKVQARVDQHTERLEREFADRMDKFKELLKSVGVDAGIID